MKFGCFGILVLSFFLSTRVFAQSSAQLDRGLKKYGPVLFADSAHHKYPLDTKQHIRIAWAFMHEKSHLAKYTKAEQAEMLRRIREAAAAHGIYLNE